mmetsp:Transcript_35933/g.86516  ORF Transcript_35933/g.86516 Transcript_35933/m.86516 type:complete len:277 (-) Transcript_35933:526-1356(-)
MLRESLHRLLRIIERSSHKLPKIHDVFHGRIVGTTELQYNLHEISEGQLRITVLILSGMIGFLKNEIREIHQADWIHAHLLQCLDTLSIGQNGFEFCPRDHVVARFIELFYNSLQFCADPRYSHLLTLHRSDSTDDFTQDADEHVHHSQSAHEHEEEKNSSKKPTKTCNIGHSNPDIVHQGAVNQQSVHAFWHRCKVPITDFRIHCQLTKSNTENVHEDQKQTQRKKNRPCRRHHPLDQYHELWHGSQQPGHSCHSRKTQQSGNAENGSIAQTSTS